MAAAVAGPLLGSPTSGADATSSSISSASDVKVQSSQSRARKPFWSDKTLEEKPVDFLRIVFEGVIAGGTAGVVVETALYPIDTIKTRLQAGSSWQWKIIWKDFYSGLAGNLAGVLPASALFIGVYEPTKQKLLKIFPENLSAAAHLTAGAVGGVAASLIHVPTEVIKQRMQTRQFNSASVAVRLVFSREGTGGFYAANRDLKDSENSMIGAVADAVTGGITTPLAVIKTRLMVQACLSNRSDDSTDHYKGIFDCVQTIAREGPTALLKGIGLRVFWIGIGGSIFFGVLERTKRLLVESRPMP